MRFNFENPTVLDVLKLNALISCCGASIPRELEEELMQTAFAGKAEKRTGNVGVNAIYGKEFGMEMKTVIPVEITGDFTRASPVMLRKQGKQWFLAVDGKNLVKMEIMPAPGWYSKKLKEKDIRLSSILQYELGVLMGTVPIEGNQGCRYFEIGKQCGFCGLEPKPKPVTPEDFAEVVYQARKEDPNVSVTLTGGNTFGSDRGLKRYIEYLRAINKRNPGVPIELEVSPPKEKELGLLEELVSAGMTSFMSNPEFFDDGIRQEIMPIKGRIPKSEYKKAFKKAQDLGLPTFAVLIAGIEPYESSLEGVEWLSRLGVTTIPLPFKPIRGSKLGDKPPINPKDFLEFTYKATKIMRDYNVNPCRRIKANNMGCSTCGGCSVEVNLDRILEKLGDWDGKV